jgi:hypothetical protein
MKIMCILFVLITYVHQDARFKKRKAMKELIVAFRGFANAPKAGDTRSSRHVSSRDVRIVCPRLKSDTETGSTLCNKLLL